MTLEKRSAILIIGCISIVVLVVMGSASFGLSVFGNDKLGDQVLDLSLEKQDRIDADNSIPLVSEFNSDTITSTFMTDTQEAHVLWADGERVIYVLNNRIYYSADGLTRRTIYSWQDSYASQAWLNESYLLIGTQLAERDPDLKAYQPLGAWLAIEISSTTPKVIKKDDTFYGPNEVLTVTIVPEPNLFFFTVQNSDYYSEHVFDSAHAHWSRLNYDPVKVPVADDMPRYFDYTDAFQLNDGTMLYSFTDARGTVAFHDQRYFSIYRYFEHEIVDATLMEFLNDSARALGRFRNEAGEEMMHLLGEDLDAMLPYNDLLWEDGWQALDTRSITRLLPDRLEAIQYDEASSLDKAARHAVIDNSEGTLMSAQGTLLEYDFSGEKRFISWYDLVNSEIKQPDAIWALPLQHVVTEEVERPQHDFGYIESQRIVVPASTFEYNTNAPIPDELWDAAGEAHMDGDYGHARTYRLLRSSWFALIDRHFYEFVDDELVSIGDMPITLTISVGDAWGSNGALDYVRLNDYWYVTDTEASRVIKLDSNLNIVAELAVPHPYDITVDGEHLQIATTTQNWTIDHDLNVIANTSQPFTSTEHLEQVDYPYFYPNQIYVDDTMGLTWYYIDESLYQYDKERQQYRSFFIGQMENFRGHVQIYPYGDEVIVMLDHRLERFDRHGDWLSTLAYPRSKPDGIYYWTPLGESSVVIDEGAGVYYLVQGFRIIAIDLENNSVHTVFRQNYGYIGEPIVYGDQFYFLFHSSYDLTPTSYYGGSSRAVLYTEVVRIDLPSEQITRYIVDGYYDVLELDAGDATNGLGDSGMPEGEPEFVLRRYR